MPYAYKTKIMKALKSTVALMAALAITIAAVAQQPAPAAKKEEPKKEQSAKQMSPKEQWTAQYNEWKPKVDMYLDKVKENGDKYPEFTTEVKKLDQMSSAFNQKIARYDAANDQEKAKYADMMKEDAKKVQEQATKVKTMYDKNWPAAEKKEAPKQQK